MRYLLLTLTSVLCLSGCISKPEGIEPVRDFELEKYLGEWFEVARLPHSFEEGLSQVTATYSRREDGGINVINRGLDANSGKWNEANGKAYFVEDVQTGFLKVSFFGPFYASYLVVALDDEYNYAMVSGPDREYLWILSRTPELNETVFDSLVNQAKAWGYDTSRLIYVEQR
ncbi:lipocalin family protein [Aestuariibacter sp. A3R04]|nr:lipocalin family protein [Aestuariibacter sp. A3R04]MBU3023565.1 lipocalin family protein [Aestuariibacter sp. A3R04]